MALDAARPTPVQPKSFFLKLPLRQLSSDWLPLTHKLAWTANEWGLCVQKCVQQLSTHTQHLNLSLLIMSIHYFNDKRKVLMLTANLKKAVI